MNSDYQLGRTPLKIPHCHVLKRLACYTTLGWLCCKCWALTTCIRAPCPSAEHLQQGRITECRPREQAVQGTAVARPPQKPEEEEELGSGRDLQTSPSCYHLPGCSIGCIRKKPRNVRMHPPEPQTPAQRVGGHSPEIRLAMVLVGTNRVRSTPNSSAAFSCSSGKGEGRVG